MVKSESTARVNIIQKAIEKKYGYVLKWLGEAAEITPEVISTGCLGLDNAIGNGGLERGLIAEFFGESGAGKSFLGYSVIKQACKQGYNCVIVDAENSLDSRLLINVGLDPKRVMVASGAPTGEGNLSITDQLMQTGDFAVIMVDSVAALVPDARMENDYDQQTMGLHARMMSAGIQKIQPVAKRSNTLLIFVNQTRNKIGAYGNPKTTTGGEALRFYASYRIEVIGSPEIKSRRLIDESTGELYGHKTTFRVIKNKRSAPFREAEVDLVYGIGYDNLGELLTIGIDMGVVNQNSAWLTFGENRWHGKDKAKLALMSDPKLAEDLLNATKNLINGGPPVVQEDSENEDSGEPVDDKSDSKKRTRKS